MYSLLQLLFNHVFKFQNSVCNGCYNLLMICLNISNITLVTLEGIDCCILPDIIDYCLMIVDIYKMRFKESNIKKESTTIFFGNLNKAKKIIN